MDGGVWGARGREWRGGESGEGGESLCFLVSLGGGEGCGGEAGF